MKKKAKMRIGIIYFLLSASFLSCKPKECYHERLNELWNSEILIYPSSIIIQNQSIYCHTDTSILKLNLKDGKKIWEHKSQGSFLSSKPLITETGFYFGGNQILQKINPEGQIDWKLNTNSKTFGLRKHKNLIINCRTNKGLFANDLITGKEVWTITPNYQQLSSTEPAIFENKLFIGGLGYDKNANGNVLSCISLEDQTEIWSYNDEVGNSYGDPIVDSSSVYLNIADPYEEGYTVKLDKNSGKVLWRVRTEPELAIVPIFKDSLVYLSSYKNGIMGLRKNSGEIVYQSPNSQYQSQTELIIFNDKLIYGNEHRELVSIKDNSKQSIISKFEYGIGNPRHHENNLYIMDGNSAVYKIIE